MVETMTSAMFRSLLLAETANFDAMGARFRSTNDGNAGAYLWGAAILLLVIGVTTVFIVRHLKQREGQTFCNTRRLFLDLCRLHELNAGQRRLLRRLAQAHGLTDAARLFVEPAYFRTAGLATELRADPETIAALSRRLFHGSSGAKAPASSR